MLKKGVISNRSADGLYAEVCFPDEDYTVTAMLPIAKNIIASLVNPFVNIGDKCVVAFFQSDYVSFADGVIIAIL
jgi:hypothetical protein